MIYIPIIISIGIINIYLLFCTLPFLFSKHKKIILFGILLSFIAHYRANNIEQKHRYIDTIHAQVIEKSHTRRKNFITLYDQKKKYRIISLFKSDNQIQIGNIVSATIKFSKYHPCHSRDFNFSQHLFINGIDHSGFSLKPLLVLKQSKPSLLNNIRHRIESTFKKQYTNYYPLAIALTTGNKIYLTNAIKESFSNNGLSHLLAISGLHISIVIYSIFKLLNKISALIPSLILRIYYLDKINLVISWIIGFVYVFISGSGIPAIRTILMATISVIGFILNRSVISISNVSVAATIILLYNPLSIYSVSFQMSFAAVTFLIHFRRSSIFMSTIIASIATMPFSLYHFYQLSTYSIFLNIIAIPLTTFVIMPILMLNILCIILYLPSIYIEFPLWLMNYIATIKLPSSVLYYCISLYTFIILIFILFIILDNWKNKTIVISFLIFLSLINEKSFHILPRIFIHGKTIGIRHNNELIVYGRSRAVPKRWARRLGNLKIKPVKHLQQYTNKNIIFPKKRNRVYINNKLYKYYHYIELYDDHKMIIDL